MKEKETAAEETVIKLEHICKSYYIGTQEVPVLTDIQLTINKDRLYLLWDHQEPEIHTDEYSWMSG